MNPINDFIAKGNSLNLDMCSKSIEENKMLKKSSYSSVVESLTYAIVCLLQSGWYK